MHTCTLYKERDALMRKKRENNTGRKIMLFTLQNAKKQRQTQHHKLKKNITTVTEKQHRVKRRYC